MNKIRLNNDYSTVESSKVLPERRMKIVIQSSSDAISDFSSVVLADRNFFGRFL